MFASTARQVGQSLGNARRIVEDAKSELVPEKVDETHSRHKDYCYSVPSCVMTIEGSVQRRARPGTWLLKPSRILEEFPSLAAYVARGEARPAYQRAFAAQLAVNTRP